MDYSPPGFSVQGIILARINGLPFPTPGDLPDPGIEPESPVSPALAEGLYQCGTWKALDSQRETQIDSQKEHAWLIVTGGHLQCLPTVPVF